MSRTYITGCEFGAQGEFYQDQASYITTGVHGGTYAAQFNGWASNWQYLRTAGGGFTNFAQSARFYFQLLGLPTGLCVFFQTQDTNPTAKDQLQMDTSGHLIVTDGTNSATSTQTITVDGIWHRIEFDCGWNGGLGRRVYVDGVLWASNGGGASTAQAGFAFGWMSATAGNALFDDILIDNDTFVTSGFPGDSYCKLLLPIGDNTLGTWTGGAGGTTNVYQGIDNAPPVGVASASGTNASQIKNASATGTQDAKFNCQTYSAAGITGSIRVNGVMAILTDGVSANTVAGGVWVDSNPSQTAPGNTFDYGNAGATVAGTYPTGWKSHFGPVSSSPSVTLSSSPVVAVRKTTASANVALVALLGVYVDWTVLAGTTIGSVPAGIPLTTPAFSPKFLFFDTGDYSTGV